MTEDKFRVKAKKAIVEYWNAQSSLLKKYGELTTRRIYVVWECKVLQNNKALFGVNFEGDGLYFEFTWNGDADEGYLDVYKKTKNIVVK